MKAYILVGSVVALAAIACEAGDDAPFDAPPPDVAVIPDAAPPDAVGPYARIHAGWWIYVNGYMEECAEIGVTIAKVEVFYAWEPTMPRFEFEFPCADMHGYTDWVPLGDPRVTIILYIGDIELSRTPYLPVNLDTPGETYRLPIAYFEF